MAMFSDDCKVIEKHLNEHPEDINTVNLDGNSPLYHAAYYNRTDIVDLLIERKADVNSLSRGYKDAALDVASRYGYIDVVNKLLSAGADANIPDKDGTIPIMWASYNGYFDIVKILTSYSDFIRQNNYEDTVIFYAIWNNKEIVEYFLDLGMDINHVDNKTQSYLHIAVNYKIKEIIELLLQRGIDVNLTNENGKAARECTTDPAILALLN